MIGGDARAGDEVPNPAHANVEKFGPGLKIGCGPSAGDGVLSGEATAPNSFTFGDCNTECAGMHQRYF